MADDLIYRLTELHRQATSPFKSEGPSQVRLASLLREAIAEIALLRFKLAEREAPRQERRMMAAFRREHSA